MLFNSFPFIFGFLPLVLVGYYFLHAREKGGRQACAFLGTLSVVFYGWWDWSFIPLLLSSIIFNYLIGRLLSHHAIPARSDRYWLAGAIGVDLAVLIWFKYSGFFFSNLNHWLSLGLPVPETLLPLGISFFTFTQIAYLVDAYRKEVRDFDFRRYLLFVTFFPHLIAGPVLHHSEVMPQFRNFRHEEWTRNFAVGLTLFSFGLFKKTVLADSLAEFATPVFAAAQAGQLLAVKEAWGGALAYTLQLYFDFSAYSDMAIGLALLFGVRFPANFNSPYQANSIIDFWRRWHMTLSRFLRDYLYIPLGGGRSGELARFRNLMLTMLLGGLWHGAGWTFIIWGGLHGFFLVINHLWRSWIGTRANRIEMPAWFGRILARALTFIAVVVGWVFFRAETVDAALIILQAMAGVGTRGVVDSLFVGNSEIRWIMAGLLIVHLLPNALQIMHRYHPALETYPGEISPPTQQRFVWSPTRGWLIVSVLAACAGILNMTKVSEFLYFQF